ncbi:MAG: MnhB domain-containing protein [Gemmiger sp.]|nr:MnhB domain-containing protein [Gemmiger sp.]
MANQAKAAKKKDHFTPTQNPGGKPHKKALGIIVRFGANLFLPLACTFGGYVVLHGDSSPGGGFQGGVLIASAVLLVFLGYGTQKLSTTFKTSFLHNTETVAELMYIAIGLIGILVGLNFAVNFVIDTFHLETAVLMNGAVGYHVMAGIGCLLIMMLGLLGTSESTAPTNPGEKTKMAEITEAERKEVGSDDEL